MPDLDEEKGTLDSISSDGALNGNEPIPASTADDLDFDEPNELGESVESPAADSTDPTKGTPAEEDEGFPVELLTAAGLTEEEAAAQFASPAELANRITEMDRRMVQQAGMIAASEQESAAAEEGEELPLGENKSVLLDPATTQTRDVNLDWLPQPDDGSDWDADAKNLIGAIDKKYQAELAKRDAELQEQREFLQAIAAEREADMERQRQIDGAEYVRQFDGFIDTIGEDYAPVFGSGPGGRLDPSSMAYQNRILLDETATQLQAVRSRMGQPELAQEELLVRALRVSFPEAQETAVESQIVQAVSDRQEQFSARPSHSGSSAKDTPAGDAKAMAGLNKWFTDRGIPQMSEYDDDLGNDI